MSLPENCSESTYSFPEPFYLTDYAKKERQEKQRKLNNQLSWVCKKGDLVGFTRLVSRGADVTVPGYKGKLPIEMACKYGKNMAIIEIIIDQGYFDKVIPADVTTEIFQLLATGSRFTESKDRDIAELICNSSDNSFFKNAGSFSIACRYQFTELVPKFLKSGAYDACIKYRWMKFDERIADYQFDIQFLINQYRYEPMLRKHIVDKIIKYVLAYRVPIPVICGLIGYLH